MKKRKYVGLKLKPKSIDVRPLDKRESPLDTRKGMPAVKCKGFFDTSEYK
jgi:hypothetical protein